MAMTKFRFHRGGYEESMTTAVDCTSYQQLREIIKAKPDDYVTVEKYGSKVDTRNGWDTHLVVIDDHVIGMTDGMPE